MPEYQWVGTRAGQTLSGAIEAPSKEEAVLRLRAQNIEVTSLLSAGSNRKGALAPIALGVLLLCGATIMASIAKGTRIQCTRSPAAYDCTMATTMAGFRVMYAEDIRGARSATDEERTSDSYDSRTRTRSTSERHRVVIAGDKTTLASEWMAYPMASSDWVVGSLNDHFARRQTPSFETWQVEIAPLAVAAVLLLTGTFLIASGVRRVIGRSAST